MDAAELITRLSELLEEQLTATIEAFGKAHPEAGRHLNATIASALCELHAQAVVDACFSCRSGCRTVECARGKMVDYLKNVITPLLVDKLTLACAERVADGQIWSIPELPRAKGVH